MFVMFVKHERFQLFSASQVDALGNECPWNQLHSFEGDTTLMLGFSAVVGIDSVCWQVQVIN